MITGISVHDRVDWVFTITGMRNQVAKTGYGRHDSASAQGRSVSMQTIGGMTDGGTGKDTYRGGSTEHDPNLFWVQPLLPEQSWQER
jgi:hypothetical protein